MPSSVTIPFFNVRQWTFSLSLPCFFYACRFIWTRVLLLRQNFVGVTYAQFEDICGCMLWMKLADASERITPEFTKANQTVSQLGQIPPLWALLNILPESGYIKVGSIDIFLTLPVGFVLKVKSFINNNQFKIQYERITKWHADNQKAMSRGKNSVKEHKPSLNAMGVLTPGSLFVPAVPPGPAVPPPNHPDPANYVPNAGSPAIAPVPSQFYFAYSGSTGPHLSISWLFFFVFRPIFILTPAFTILSLTAAFSLRSTLVLSTTDYYDWTNDLLDWFFFRGGSGINFAPPTVSEGKPAYVPSLGQGIQPPGQQFGRRDQKRPAPQQVQPGQQTTFSNFSKFRKNFSNVGKFLRFFKLQNTSDTIHLLQQVLYWLQHGDYSFYMGKA